MSEREANLLSSVTETSWRFYVWVGGLSAVVCWGLFAYLHQVRQGLIVTGMRDQISWGLYITNFVFFIGISKGGTLISAVLRLTHAEWRRPITRLAEGVTVFALCIGAPMVILDLGRPDRMLNLFRYGRIQSTIVWDVLGVVTYLIASVVYLYLPLIPDLATLASHTGIAGWRRRVYKRLSVGWTGSPEQWQLLERAIGIMAIVVIPLAISVHTVLSWIFAMTLRPGWNTAIFGPYFVMGALYSGCAVVIISMYVLRKIFRLEGYLEQVHFRNLGTLLLVFCMLLLYFTINEYLTMGYKSAGAEKGLLERVLTGDYAPYFWVSEMFAIALPLLLLGAVVLVKRWHKFIIPGTVLASAFVVAALWLERFVIVVPTLSSPFLPMQGVPAEWMHYRPTWVEWSITTAAFAAFLLIYSLMSKLFPLVSIWETREVETVPAREARPVPTSQPHPYMPASVSVLLIACLLTAAVSARAEEPSSRGCWCPETCLLTAAVAAQAEGPHPGKPRKAAVISLQSLNLPSAKPQAAGPEGANSQPVSHSLISLVAKRLFGYLIFRPDTDGVEKPFSATALNVSLRDEEGKPLSYQGVRFVLETSFGSELSFGSRPTNAEGNVQLVMNDRRCGNYLVKAIYLGNEGYTPTVANASADFGPCPPPSLPDVGILITPYRTPAITIPFLGFYGITWFAVIYSLGYLVLWRVRRSGQGRGNQGSLHAPGTGSGGEALP